MTAPSEENFSEVLSLEAGASAQEFFCKWSRLERLFCSCSSVPCWSSGTIISPELRAEYERWLPIRDFLSDLARVARKILPHPSWLPRPVRSSFQHCTRYFAAAPHSLPDLWRTLPPQLAGKAGYRPNEVIPLLCAMADPLRFGTDTQRYPAQLDFLLSHLGDRPGCTLAIMDLACGVGHGSLEMAQTLHRNGVCGAMVIGLTREPLEAWMATVRRLPHDAGRGERLPSCSCSSLLHFIAGDVRSLPVRCCFDVLICNGLIGGDYLCTTLQLEAFLNELRRVLSPCGVLLVANHFHAGRQAALEQFTQLAVGKGWGVSGALDDLRLQ